MKLFIWNDPYPVNYGGSFLFVIAPNIETARERAVTATITRHGSYASLSTDDIVGEVALTLKEPDRVINEFPYGECYEWGE